MLVRTCDPNPHHRRPAELCCTYAWPLLTGAPIPFVIGSPFVSDFTGSQGVPCARLYDLLTRRYGVLTVALESVSYDARVRIKWDHMGVHPAPEGHELLALAVASTISHDLASRSHDLASRSHEASSIQLPPRASLSESPPILLSSAWEDIDRAWTCQVCLWDGSLAPIRIPPIPSRIPPHRIAIWVGSLSLSLRSWIPLVSGSHLGQDPTWVRIPLGSGPHFDPHLDPASVRLHSAAPP
jgi:hypothetical protein